ncbi:hypothetical protein [Lysinibacillus endophyticus]|uniref:hypothetical protein n=1 Tax=Ureibacillus endophyticus TaxID=1978490 RepID=UPI00209DC3B5|nr:hypothetical protein [Lysinibacillus endophyticus]MCP1144637.1 hypothetical protein [Lysinibacillus endophyticus]
MKTKICGHCIENVFKSLMKTIIRGNRVKKRLHRPDEYKKVRKNHLKMYLNR